MAELKAKQLREMKLEDLNKKLSELRLELMKEIANAKLGRPVKNPGKIRKLKRAIARILTIKKEKSGGKK
ncbi:MAG: 50S ribosomal protein L29 [Candidatus Aenigmarchaeota archaeon]|nr:50S ribosomal protein L29 [Candidatus Aenigmarchaeota archaeon]